MRRRFAALLPVLIAVAACASPANDPGTTEGASETTVGSTVAEPGPATTSDGAEDVTTTSSPEATETTSGRPLAPDFTLELGEGGTYTLSEGARPVYLVFWAEW